MTDEVMEMKAKAEHASFLYNIGKLSREDAKEDIQPYLDAVNKKQEELAKKYKQKVKKVTFNTFVR